MNEKLSEIELFRAEMKAGFDEAFAQRQRGFDELRQRMAFLDERLRKEMNHGFSRIERRFEAVDAQFDRVDKRFEAIDARFDRVDQRFEAIEARLDRQDQRFDEIIRLIKER